MDGLALSELVGREFPEMKEKIEGERANRSYLAQFHREAEDETLYAAHIGSDFLEEGRRAAAWIEQEFRAEDSVRIIHIHGTLGSTAQLGRTAALEEAVAVHENWELLAQLDGDFTQAKSYEVMTDYLSSLPGTGDIDVVYCENDNIAFGALQALEEQGYTCGPRGGNHSVIALGALCIVAFEKTGDLPVPFAGQVLGQLIAPAVVVVRHTGDTVQPGAGAVEKNDGGAGLLEALVERGVGRGEGGLGPFCQKAAHRLLQQPEEDLPLRADAVSRGVDGGGIPLAGEDAGDVVKGGREDIVIQTGGHHRDLPGRRAGKKAGGVGPAALPPLDQPLLLQKAQGMADGLTAQVILPGKLLLRGQFISGLSAVPEQLLPEPLRQELILCRHIRAPLPLLSASIIAIATAQQMVQDEVDYLLLSPASTTGWDTVLQDAKTAGTQVILFDRMLEADESMYAAAVVSDMPAEGKTAVDWLAGQGMSEYNIIHIQGHMGSDAQLGRTGALDEMEAYPLCRKARYWKCAGSANTFPACALSRTWILPCGRERSTP